MIKIFYLKRRLKMLEYKRNREIIYFMESHPSQAAKMDNIEKYIDSKSFYMTNFKIKAISKLLEQFNKK